MGGTRTSVDKVTADYRVPEGHLKFDSDWNWIMTVYHIIVNIVNKEEPNDDSNLYIQFNIIYDSLGDGEPIINVWKNIVEFIYRYNE